MAWKITPSLYNSWLFYRYPQFDRDEEQEKAARHGKLSRKNARLCAKRGRKQGR